MLTRSSKRTRIDYLSFAGIAVAISAITFGLIKEGGDLADLRQVTAALIVLGGTLGAVMLTTPAVILGGSLRQIREVFFHSANCPKEVVDCIIGLSHQARTKGIISLDHQVGLIDDPFLCKALTLAIDGTDVQQLRSTMELQIEMDEAQGYAEAKVLEAAGGYAPTIGIIGAVLGLIQVMKQLDNMSHVGPGIAMAFVATLYGVAAANLLFLPIAGKIKARVQESTRSNELVLEGVVNIVKGIHPDVIRLTLGAYMAPAAQLRQPRTIEKYTVARAA